MTSRTAPLRPGRGHCWVPWQQPAWWVVCLWHVCCWRIAPDHGLPASEFEFQPWGRGGLGRRCGQGTAALALPPAPAPSCGCLTPLPPLLPPAVQTLQSSAALAEDLATGTASKQQAQELGRLLEQRGAKLPTLNSSPQV